MTDNAHALLGSYVLNAVSADERADFESHLAACPDCRAEVAQLTEVVASLADAHAVAPPATLRAKVMSAASRTPQAAPGDVLVDVAPAASADAVDSSDAPVADAPASLDEARERRTGTRRWVPRLTVAAASALVVALAAVGIGAAMGGDTTDAALEKDVMMIASAPDATSMDLNLGTSHMVMSDRMDAVALMGSAAPMPADGMEYQVWLVMTDGSVEAGPCFMPDDEGAFMAMAHVDVEHVVAIAITQEPVGGSDEPSSDPVTVTNL